MQAAVDLLTWLVLPSGSAYALESATGVSAVLWLVLVIMVELALGAMVWKRTSRLVFRLLLCAGIWAFNVAGNAALFVGLFKNAAL